LTLPDIEPTFVRIRTQKSGEGERRIMESGGQKRQWIRTEGGSEKEGGGR
jgi:hypothetical protein